MNLVNKLLEASDRAVETAGAKEALLYTIIAEKRLKVLEHKKKIEYEENLHQYYKKQREEHAAIDLEQKRLHVISRDKLYLVIAIALTVQIFVIIGLCSYFNS